MRLVFILLLLITNIYAINNKNVLILNSYHKGFKVSDTIIKNIETKFYSNNDINVDILYMDAKQIYSRDYIKGLSDLYSLQLKNITTQLSRSRNFRPLLHLGWRQPTFIKQNAIPFHLYAGDNLALDYKTKLSSYQKRLLVSEKTEQNLDNLLIGLTADDKSVQLGLTAIENSANTFNTAQNEATKAQLDNILLQFNEQPFNVLVNSETPQNTTQIQDDAITNLITELEQDTLDSNSASSFINQRSIRETGAIQVPTKPLQPWYLDGFVKVHVKKYLHITANLSILNQTLAEQATNTLKANQTNTLAPEIKTIRFQQDRRVISGEIHYFDHPYIGMIVQIRKHKRPEPKVEINAEDSSKKTDN